MIERSTQFVPANTVGDAYMAERARSLARSLAQAMLEADREWSEITGSDNIANARQYEETERLFLNNFRVELSTKRRTARWLTQIRMSVK